MRNRAEKRKQAERLELSEERIYDRALRLLAVRPRSIAELRGRLLKIKGVLPSRVEPVIDKLKSYGFLDDIKFAESFASYRTRQMSVGRRRLERELALKQVSRETASKAIEAAYHEATEEELLIRAIEKRVRSKGVPQDLSQTRNLVDHLIRLGFPTELIITHVKRLKAKMDYD
jgi:regulatory protein